MISSFYANIHSWDSTSAPDEYQTSSGLRPNDEFIVARNRTGQVASRFGDLTWDFTAYTTDKSTKRLHFAYWGTGSGSSLQKAVASDIQFLIFNLIWRRPGRPLSVGTLYNYTTVLCACASFAEEQEVPLVEVMGSAHLLKQFTKTRSTGWMTESLGSLLGCLVRIGEESLGFPLVSNKALGELKRPNVSYRAGVQQHPPIPTRLYSQLLSGLQDELHAWSVVSDELLALFAACGADPLLGRSRGRQRVVSPCANTYREYRPSFKELISDAGRAFMEERGMSAKRLSHNGLSNLVADMQTVSKTLIVAFTGMRDEEATTLPYHCVVQSAAAPFIKGYTSKYNSGLRVETRWVTAHEATIAVHVAQKIADTIYAQAGVRPVNTKAHSHQYPLFVSVRYMRGKAESKSHETWFIAGKYPNTRLPSGCIGTIEEQDLRELEQIDPHRAWRSEGKFSLALSWPFTMHQLRRSLALYAQRSGLVSLPSLRRQLKHITAEMSRYYARGSAFANDIVSTDKHHFAAEWQSAEAESAGLAYILNVLLTDDKLLGAHANWVQHRLSGPDGVVVFDRKLTMSRFLKGELAYRETVLGGCVTVEPCEKIGIGILQVPCVDSDCKNLVCTLPKLDRVIAAQSNLLRQIDPLTVEYRIENADLNTLKQARKRMTMKAAHE